MASKILRPYQQAAIDSVFDWYASGKKGHPLVVAPVGAGKSLLIAEFIRRVQDTAPRAKIVVLAHVMELLTQNAEELKSHHPSCDFGFYSAGLGQKRLHHDVTFAGIQSVCKKAGAFPKPPDILIIDECHLISHNDQTTYRKFISDCEALNPNLCVIGFTGTPFRADTGRLEEGEGKLFDGVAYEISMGFMIEQGYWAKPITAKTDYTMDVSGVGKRGGDYIISQLEEKVDTDEVTLACVVRMLDCCADRNRVLVFTAGVQHCEHVRDALRAAGQFAEMVTGETPKEEREGIIKRFKAGDFKYLVNVAVLTTGFNVPEIDALVFMRPTQSPVLYIQCVGRGVRTVYAQGQFDLGTTEGRLASIAASGKKDCLVVDFGGVVDRLGPIDAVEIRKSNRVKNEDEPAGEAILKRCPSCGEMCAAAQRYCYSCSYSFIQQALDPNLKNTEITTIDEAPEWHEVMGVSYNKHEKNGKPPSMAVSYATMNGPFREWICFEHEGYARDKARAWFQMRLPGAKVPDTVSEALAHKYQVPHRICVKRDGKFFRIVDFDWTVKPRDKPVVEDLDDYDIPF